jgi:hypothetical protein
MFPSDSAWEDQRARESREADLQANQDRALGESLELAREAASIALPRTTRSVPIDVLEEWAGELEYIAGGMRDDVDALAVEGIAHAVRAFLPG